MTTAEIKRLITENGLYPIPVTGDDEESSTPRFDGTLDDFWPAVKALGATVIFLSVLRFDESDFERPVPSDDAPYDEEGEDDEAETSEDGDPIVKLEELLPSISKFRKHLDKECAFVLSTKGGVAELEILVQADWWKEFLDEADKAVELWKDKQSERREKAEAENEEREHELVATLKGLIDDRAFCVLPTQRAMKTYALEKFPELDDLPEETLKIEIQTLHDKIQTKGLNRKR